MIPLLSAVAPIYRHMAIGALALAAMAWAYVKGAEHEERANAAMLVKQQAQSAEQTATWQRRKDDALRNAQDRATKNEAAAASARSESERLRIQLASSRRELPNIARDALDGYASTLSDVFGECSAEYQALAGEVGAVASDRQTLIDAWPK
jgi:multidrug efflux pump subunit AcrA (membrane-fusion protein)